MHCAIPGTRGNINNLAVNSAKLRLRGNVLLRSSCKIAEKNEMWSLAVVSFFLIYICILLIGSHEYFQGTVVERWHYALTDGVCDVLE